MLRPIRHQLHTKLFFGSGELDSLAREPLPGQKALLLTSNGTSAQRSGAFDRVVEILNERRIGYVHLGIVEPNPLDTTVERAAQEVRDQGCDFIIALGGGSVMDCAKAVGLVAANGGKMWDYMQQGTGGRQPITVDPVPLVAITTTAGTGSEVDGGGVITNAVTREKMGFGGHPGLYPVMAIVDPDLMLTVPAHLSAYQGFDALFHAIEGYLTKRSNWLGDMYALESIRHLAKNLPLVIADGLNLQARTHVAFANTLSGYVMTTERLTSQHAMEHALSAFHPALPHGAGLIMLSLAYFGHMIRVGAQSGRFVTLARALGKADAVVPQDFLIALADLQRACNVHELKMSDWGVTEDEIPALAENARATGASLFEQDAVALTFEDTVSIYQAAYR